MNLYLPMIRY